MTNPKDEIDRLSAQVKVLRDALGLQFLGAIEDERHGDALAIKEALAQTK